MGSESESREEESDIVALRSGDGGGRERRRDPSFTSTVHKYIPQRRRSLWKELGSRSTTSQQLRLLRSNFGAYIT